jgi:hypothetical protein
VRGKLILIGVLIALVAVFLISKYGFERKAGEEPLYPGLSAERAQTILVKGKSSEAQLDKVDGVWIVASEDSLPAEAQAVDNMFQRMAAFSRRDIVSANPEKQALYQVDSTGIEVTIKDASGKDLASFIIGKVGPDYQSTYVRDLKSDDVVLSAGYLPPIFDRGERTWQDRTIFSYEPSDIAEVVLTRPTGIVRLSRDKGGAWYISQPESAACDQGRVTRLVRTLAYLRGDGIVGRSPVAGSGLADADSSVWFKTTGGTEEHLRFGNRSESGQTYVRRDGSDVVFKLVSSRVAATLPRLDELLPKAPQAASPGASPPPASGTPGGK